MGLPLPDQPTWVGFVGILGIFGVVALIYALRDAGERARQVAAATGALFLAYVLVRALSGVVSIGAVLASGFTDYGEAEWAFYVALVAVGVAAGVGIVLAAHRRVAEAAEDLADDALVEPDEPDPSADVIGEEDEPYAYDDYTAKRQRIVAVAPWTDLAAVVLALALPTVTFGSWTSYGEFFGGSNAVSVWAVLHHVLGGAILAAPLLVLVRRETTDLRFLNAAAVVLAARVAAAALFPVPLSNRYWTALAFGLAAGLVTVAALPLLAPAIPEDRTRLVAGLLAALALLTADVVVYGRAQYDLSRDSFSQFEDGG